MADPTENLPPAGLEAQASAGGLKGFVASSTGRILIAGIALLAVVGIVAMLVLTFLGGGQEAKNTDLQVKTPVVSAPATEAEPKLEPTAPLADTFSFRDVFQQTIKVSQLSTVQVEASSTIDISGLGELEPDTLYLYSITQVTGGEDLANLVWNNSVYSLPEGGRIADTPWEVVTISTDSVVMLYGDSRVTLVVGQSMSTSK